MRVMLPRCVVVLLLFCLVSVLVLPANGQEKLGPVPRIPLEGEYQNRSGLVQPVAPLPALDQTGVPPVDPPHERLENRLTDQLSTNVVDSVVGEADSQLITSKEAKPVVVGKCKNGPVWFTSMSGLVMTRDHANDVELSFNTAPLTPGLLTTRDAAMEWGGGFDIRFGRFFNERQQAWEVVYWGLFSDAEVADATDPDGVSGTAADLNTTFQFDLLSYNGLGNPVVDLFNGAARHRLIRDYEFHNVEVNLWGNTNGLVGGRGLQVGWLAGIRFFRFRDSLQFLTDDSDGVFTGAVDEVTYSVDTENRLLGVQLGGLAQQGLTDHWNLYGGIKVGLFGNHITNSSLLGGTAGSAFVDDPGGPFDLDQYRIHTHKNDVAILGEIDMGVTYQIRERWRAFFGYRAAALAGVGLSTNQFPTNFSELDEARIIRSNGSLILHGGYGGIELLY